MCTQTSIFVRFTLILHQSEKSLCPQASLISRNLQINSLLILLVSPVSHTNVNKLWNQSVTISSLHALGIQTSADYS